MRARSPLSRPLAVLGLGLATALAPLEGSAQSLPGDLATDLAVARVAVDLAKSKGVSSQVDF